MLIYNIIHNLYWYLNSYDNSIILLDLGVIRVSSPKSPNVKVFRVRIKVWKEIQVDDQTMFFPLKFGMAVEINSQVFEPNYEVLERIQNNHKTIT
jgi:hypothetical protein